jgi:DNA-binding LacI/PurR family transcriptional regulator/DNA-binding transcriptional regulator YhcF (GntR family)
MGERGICRAAKFVQALINTHLTNDASKRLPPISQMAVQAGVAQATMWKVVRDFQRRGWLEVAQKRGIYVVEGGGSQHPLINLPTASARRHWEEIAHLIRKAIYDGDYGPEALLPAIKELCYAHGCSFVTVKKALNMLCEQGHVERYKRRYRVRGLRFVAAAGGLANSVVLIARQNWFGGLAQTAGSQENFRSLEKCCAEHGLELDCALLNTPEYSHGRTIEQQLGERVGAAASSVLGYLILTTGIDESNFTALLSLLIVHNKPIIIVDEQGLYPVGRRLLENRYVRVISMSNTARCGRIVGQYLLTRGHRSVAYVSPYHFTPWSQARLQGVEEVFREAGLESQVHALLTQTGHRLAKAVVDANELNEALYHLIATSGERAEAMMPRISAQLARVEENLLSNNDRAGLWAQEWSEELAKLIVKQKVSAVIGANDHVALLCYNVLLKMGYTIPRDIALIGFDNRVESSFLGLSSYSFNNSAVMQRCVEYIVAPFRWPHRAQVEELDGFVHERRTTR